MNIEFIGFTIEVLGKLLVSYTVIMVHHRVWKEHKIDDLVFEEMRRERVLGVIGFALIVLGYAFQVPSKL